MSSDRSCHQAVGVIVHGRIWIFQRANKVKEVCFIDGVVPRPDDPLRKTLYQSGVTGETHQSTPNEGGGERMAT